MRAVWCRFAEFALVARVECTEQPEAIKPIRTNATAAIADEEWMQRIPRIVIPLPGSVRNGVEAVLVIDGLCLRSLQKGQPLRRNLRMVSIRHHTTCINRCRVLIGRNG